MELKGKTLRFIIVGVAAALVYFFCSYLLLAFTELAAYVASLLAYACSFGFAYLGQKCWAFRSTAKHRVTLFRYAILQVFCASFAASFTQISTSYSDMSPLLLSALATVFTSAISYVLSSCWVFAEAAEQEEVLEALNDYSEPLDVVVLPMRTISIISAWLVACIVYTLLYYHMPWSINLYAGYDDRLFVNLAHSLSSGHWLGHYSQYTLMKGPGYAFFLALAHQLSLPLYLLTAIFHCIAVSFFAWCLYKLSYSRSLTIIIFCALLVLPMAISNGRIIRDQIYPDQLLIGFSALICSLFIANSAIKRGLIAMMSGLMFAWFGLTREEGIWIVPTVVLLMLFALVHLWRSGHLKQGLLSSVLVLAVSFFAANLVFQFVNWQVYGQFVGLDIKEKNFKEALAALQSVQEGKTISHVPVSQQAIQRIYEVSPRFAELKPYFDSTDSEVWTTASCKIYIWACAEYAGGWFIWALREAAASEGYYQSPIKAAVFFQQLAREVNQACDDGRLSCQKSFLSSYMPKMAKWDLNEILDALVLMRDVIFLRGDISENIRLRSELEGDYTHQRKLLDYLHSGDRFKLESIVSVSGQYAINREHKENIEIKVFTDQGEERPFSVLVDDKLVSAERFVSFTLSTVCLEDCHLVIFMDGSRVLSELIPKTNHVFAEHLTVLGPLRLRFDKIILSNALIGVLEEEERSTYQVRKILIAGLQQLLPVLVLSGLIAFCAVSLVLFSQRSFPVLWAVSGVLWLAILARLTILFLVHISSFPALNTLYFMPLYSLLLIASSISLYLLFSCCFPDFQNKCVERG